MMYNDGSLASTRGPAYPTTIPVTLQDSLTEPAEVFLILPLECVTRRTEAKGEDFLISAPAIHCSLCTLRHIDLPEFKSVMLVFASRENLNIARQIRRSEQTEHGDIRDV
jgi:hypothetical protein